jgi:class 3 adenylate cyclase
MLAAVIAKQAPPDSPIWQTLVVILAAIALLATFVYAANRFRHRSRRRSSRRSAPRRVRTPHCPAAELDLRRLERAWAATETDSGGVGRKTRERSPDRANRVASAFVPMYIDRHDAPGISPEELAAAHHADVSVQEKYGVQYHTYWFDPDNGTIFCLAEGPSREAVEDVHREAHGQLASVVLEIDANAPLNSFLGSPPTHPVGEAYVAPALRAIVFTDICGSVAQTQELGDEGHIQLLKVHNDIVRAELAAHGGREVKHTGDGIMASFNSVASSIAFAVAVQRSLAQRNERESPLLLVSIGISAGEPVTDEHDDLFGAAVQLAARICAAADAGQIAVSVAVRELCVGKSIRFEDRGPVALKGLSEPANVFNVPWQD